MLGMNIPIPVVFRNFLFESPLFTNPVAEQGWTLPLARFDQFGQMKQTFPLETMDKVKLFHTDSLNVMCTFSPDCENCLWDGGFGVAISFYNECGIKIELPLNLYCTSNWSICLGGGFKWPMSHGRIHGAQRQDRWFQMFFYFYPYLGIHAPIWRAYFSDGLKPSTSCLVFVNCKGWFVETSRRQNHNKIWHIRPYRKTPETQRLRVYLSLLIVILFYMGVSKNKGTPKWMVYDGKPY